MLPLAGLRGRGRDDPGPRHHPQAVPISGALRRFAASAPLMMPAALAVGRAAPDATAALRPWAAPLSSYAAFAIIVRIDPAYVTALSIPATLVAVVNAYQIHCLEYDCEHEAAAVHPMATVLSALVAWCERRAGRRQPVSGRDFLLAMCIGIGVATLMGVAAYGPIRWFRPAPAACASRAPAGGTAPAAARQSRRHVRIRSLCRRHGLNFRDVRSQVVRTYSNDGFLAAQSPSHTGRPE